jgi:hypothetical protein
MKKVTKKAQEQFLKRMLASNPNWATRALVRVYENQTEDEQNSAYTIEDNGVGFTGADATILTSFTEQYLRRGSLSPKQYTLLHKKIGKYWRQILAVSDVDKLNSMIIREEA